MNAPDGHLYLTALGAQLLAESPTAYLYFNTQARAWYVRAFRRDELVGYSSRNPDAAVREAEGNGHRVRTWNL